MIFVKGQIQTLVILIVVMVLLYGFLRYIFALQAEAVQRGAVLNAIQVSNIINMLQASPNDAFQIYTLPDAKCTLEIKESYVKLTVYDQSFKRYLIQTSTKIEEAKIECNQKEKSRNILCITKKNGVIKVKELVNTCW